MNWKTLFRVAILGALVGTLLSSWLGPKLIAWYFNPPVSFGVTCTEPVKWAMARLQTTQLVGTLVGGVLGIILYYVFRKTPSETGL